jgi:hypothetical protein
MVHRGTTKGTQSGASAGSGWCTEVRQKGHNLVRVLEVDGAQRYDKRDTSYEARVAC